LELTKDEAVRLHRELWDWLSKNPENAKEDWPGWRDMDIYIVNNCFGCAFTIYPNVYAAIKCKMCLLKWPNNHCGYIHTPWERSNNIKERTRLAEQIRDRPIREDD